MSVAPLSERLQGILNAAIVQTRPLQGGCIGDVLCADLADGRRVVIKTMGRSESASGADLTLEGWMLDYLRLHSALPVPEVLHAEPDLLVMEFLPGESRFSKDAEEHAAELLAALHGVRRDSFGLERDTLIGGLHQPNPPCADWLAFFAEHRILHMARCAHAEGKVSVGLLRRLEVFCGRLDAWLLPPEHPSLLHGDVWTTNVLARNGRITGFLDPAVYYGHPEIELAFATLFGTFGEAFFKRYHSMRPIPDGFFELRRDLYNLYPLLVHVRLFGSGYLSVIEQTLRRVGC